VPNNEKSIWQPVRTLTWLGITVNLDKKFYSVPIERIERILVLIEKISAVAYVSLRRLASLTGTIMSCKFVLGNVVRLKTRSFYTLIESRTRWDTKVNRFNYKNIEGDLMFWKDNLQLLNRRYIKDFHIPMAFCFSDASSVAVGAIIKGNDFISHKNLSIEEKNNSSTWRELYAIFNSLNDFRSFLKNKNVLWHTDMPTSRIVEVGSGKDHLQTLALDIFDLCKTENISLKCEWIPRELNVEADAISKYIDFDDWIIFQNIFEDFNTRWGPFTIDRFADSFNTKLTRFNLKFYCCNTEGVNALIKDWSKDNNWLVPPIGLISNVIKQVIFQKASGVLIIPKWKSAKFWPLLVNYDETFKEFIKDFVYISKGCERFILRGTGSKNFKLQGYLAVLKL